MMKLTQRGFGIISAIFILVVLGGLAAFVVGISNSQHVGSAQDLQGVRALQAARAGIEWGLFQVKVAGSGCPAAITELPIPATATSLAGISVTVTCTSGGSPTVFRLTATACTQPNAAPPGCPNTTNLTNLYVERQLEVTF